MSTTPVSTDSRFVILPNGARHSIPVPIFLIYKHLNLIRVSSQNPHLARVNKALLAWPDGVMLRFAQKNRKPIDRYGIPSNWRHILELSPYCLPNEHEAYWQDYDALERQYAIA